MRVSCANNYTVKACVKGYGAVLQYENPFLLLDNAWGHGQNHLLPVEQFPHRFGNGRKVDVTAACNLVVQTLCVLVRKRMAGFFQCYNGIRTN
jgi:hypothetical protein